MNRKIKLLKNNAKKDWDDLEWINEFFNFLQGDIPESIRFRNTHKPKLSQKKAFAIIYYLQEHFPLLPDYIEQCGGCGNLFDFNSEGLYWETKGKHYCDECTYLVPENYDRGKR